ncbi:MAG: dockerin type I domain-containing protein, partial [Phycisphaerae bacterium]
ATVLLTLAGTTPDGGNDGNPPNPAFDTRVGTITPFSGNSGMLTGVYLIQDLQVELWYDSILGNSATASVLGTFQHFTRFGGWLVLRDCETGVFPVLAGEGLGSTQWPAIDTTAVGLTFNTAHGLEGGFATIQSMLGIDDFTLPGNGGLPLTDGGGDLGAYLDGVVIPLLGPDRDAFVYLESAAFGINNSGDPIYGDTIGYDLVAIAAADSVFPVGDVNGDGVADLGDGGVLINVLLDPASASLCEIGRADVNGDGSADGQDIQALLNVLL